MHVILRRALFFLFPLLFLSVVLTLLVHSISGLPKKPYKQSSKQAISAKNTDLVAETGAVSGSGQADTRGQAVANPSSVNFQPVIVLDPTHGGSDLGSLSETSFTESNINLVFSFKLARALRMRGFKVFLTRMDDDNPSLEQRFKEAATYNPVLYLSINCGYSHNKRISGVEVYGFTTELQHTEIEKVKNGFYEFYEGVYETKGQDSLALENRVSSVIKTDLDLPYKSRLLRRFLKNLALPSNIPALAIFVGYISNEKEAKKLSNPKYSDELAEKLAVAVEDGIIKKI